MRSASIVLFALGLELVVIAFVVGGATWALLWPATALSAVALAYGTANPSVFGKRGRALRFTHRVILLPYLFVQDLVWHVMRRLSREAAFAQLTTDVFIGRRLLAHEYPTGLASIVDLTCEFTERLPEYGPIVYVGFPILDGGSPRPSALVAMVEKMDALPRPVYLHCAQGHGRTATVAAALLLQLRLVDTVDDALERVRAVRPKARPRKAQLAALRGFCALRQPSRAPGHMTAKVG